jgi:hypothetical protein
MHQHQEWDFMRVAMIGLFGLFQIKLFDWITIRPMGIHVHQTTVLLVNDHLYIANTSPTNHRRDFVSCL